MMSFEPFKLLLTLSRLLSPSRKYKNNHHLITIGFSHFCEKARWALDLSPLRKYYVEEEHCPFFHLSTTLMELRHISRIGKPHQNDEYVAKKKEITAVPKLVIPATEGGILVVRNGSGGIIRFLSDRYHVEFQDLIPTSTAESVDSLERYLDVNLGQASSDWTFANLLLCNGQCNQESLNFFIRNCIRGEAPVVEKLLFRALARPFIIPTIIANNYVSNEKAEIARCRILEVFERMDELLLKNRTKDLKNNSKSTYLLGTSHITAADITLASLAIPVLLPDETKAYFGSLDEVSDCIGRNSAESVAGLIRIAEFAKTLRRTPTGKYVLQLYRNERNPRPQNRNIS